MRLLQVWPAPWEEHTWQHPCQHYTDIATLCLFRSLRTSKNSFHLEKPTKIAARDVFLLSTFPTWCASLWLVMTIKASLLRQGKSCFVSWFIFALTRGIGIQLQPWHCKWHHTIVILVAVHHLLWFCNLNYIVFSVSGLWGLIPCCALYRNHWVKAVAPKAR